MEPILLTRGPMEDRSKSSAIGAQDGRSDRRDAGVTNTAVAAAKPSARTVDTTSALNARVMVVEDDRDLLVIFRKVLESAGFEVVTALDGKQALRRFRKERFDAVITDISMPEMDGMELIRLIRLVDLDVPVVIVTAAPSVNSAIKAIEYGALRYLTKPVPHGELINITRQAVRLHEIARLKREALALSGIADRDFGDRASLDAIFDKALDALFIVYQPIVSWSEQRTVAYEALMRSDEPRMGNPVLLLDAAERLGRLRDIGRRVRELAPEPFDRTDLRLFVNLHSSDLEDETLHGSDTKLAAMPDRVVLEITEKASLVSVDNVYERVSALRKMGYGIAVDDLGAGYAGLTSFGILEPEVCKLDMSLIRGIDSSSTKQKIVGSVVGLCRDMEIDLVTEGVETFEERDTLLNLGCDLMQGYLFSRPGPAFPKARF